MTPSTGSASGGRLYEFVTFAISNSGALPVELRDKYPSRFKPLAGALPGRSQGQRECPLLSHGAGCNGLDTCDANGDRLQEANVYSLSRNSRQRLAPGRGYGHLGRRRRHQP